MKDKEGMEIYNEEDREFIADMFADDDLKVPESLSKENIKILLEEKAEAAEAEPEQATEPEPEQKTVKKHSWTRPFGWAAAIAACLLLALFPVMNSEPDKAEDGELKPFSSYNQLYKTLDDMLSGYESGLKRNQEDEVILEDGNETYSAESGEAPADPKVYAGKSTLGSAQPNADSSAAGSSGEGSHSDTYIQVEGVDEADKVKVDGKYLYYIDSLGYRVYICSADNGKTKQVSVITAEDEDSIEDIFLAGDRLVTVGSRYSYENGEDSTVVTVYDITDRKHPKKTADYIQSGRPVSQRMVGDIVYLVTDQYAYNRGIPYCGSSADPVKLEAKEIYCVPSPADAEYTVVGAVDISSGKELSHVTKAVLGGSQDIYANGENLYIAGRTIIDKKKIDKQYIKYNPVAGGMYIRPYYIGHEATMIIKVRMAGGKIKVLSTGTVRGVIDDQFSMDEKDGNFRIATTSQTANGQDTNNLFVLDKDLKELGHVSGFARGESIKAVRYVKDKAYVITYEETDPLFVIDLSDSKEPRIEGEVKIDGFSTLLVPLSEDRLLGIGYGVKQVEDWQETAGLKFVIFDVSDPADPKVVTSKTVDGTYSNVQDDHRALVMIGEGENARFVLPCWKEFEDYAVIEDAEGEEEDYEEYEEEGNHGGVLTITASDDKIKVVNYDETEEFVSRCPVIEKHIYAICDDDEIISFKLK